MLAMLALLLALVAAVPPRLRARAAGEALAAEAKVDAAVLDAEEAKEDAAVGQAGVDLAEAVEAETTAKSTAARLETDVESALSREQAQDLAQAAKSLTEAAKLAEAKTEAAQLAKAEQAADATPKPASPYQQLQAAIQDLDRNSLVPERPGDSIEAKAAAASVLL